MQGSSAGASSLLYSASAVTVRFFDAVALALFAPDLSGRRFRNVDYCGRRLVDSAETTARQGKARLVDSGERTRPRVLIAAPHRDALGEEKFAMAGAPSPAREARALPKQQRAVWRTALFSGSDFRLAGKTAVQFFVALRGR